jgi:hypothetical protein
VTERVAAPLLLGRNRVLIGEVAGAVAGIAYLMVVDPHDPRAQMPACPVKLVTSLDCPACGSLRLAHDVLHGDARAAVHDNLFVLLTSPLLVYLLSRHWRAVRAGQPVRVPRPLAYGLFGAALAWMAVRNLPGWPLKPSA